MAVNYQIQRLLTALSHPFNQSLLHYLYPSSSAAIETYLKPTFARVIRFISTNGGNQFTFRAK